MLLELLFHDCVIIFFPRGRELLGTLEVLGLRKVLVGRIVLQLVCLSLVGPSREVILTFHSSGWDVIVVPETLFMQRDSSN